MRSFNLLIAAFALLQVVRYARSLLLFVVPSLRVAGEAGAEPESPARLRVGAELQAAGFSPLGVVRTCGPLGAGARDTDAYVSVSHGVYADVVQARPADAAHIELFTPFPDGAAVLTSTAARRPVVSGRAQIGALRGAAIPALLAAHGKAVERFARTHGAPDVGPTLDRRVEAARRWYAGEGRRDLRRSHLTGFLVAVIALALFASSAQMVLRAGAP